MKQKYFILILLWTTQFLFAQKNNFQIPDSLKKRDYKYLDDRIYELKNDSISAALYLYTYLSKAQREQNWKEISNAYQNLLHQSPEQLRLIYADSMIYAAKKSKDDALIGSAYLSKGIEHYRQKRQNEALDNYLTANSYISRTSDNYLRNKVKYQMAQIKYYLGFYDEAISLFRNCISYFKTNSPRPYLNSLHCLGLCYNKIGNYGLCSQTNNLGLSECKRLNNTEMVAYFMHSDGINEYFKENYNKAITKIESSLEDITANKDFANQAVGNFYIGKSYWQLKKQDKALPYFKKVDKAFNDKGYIRPDLREVYELLIAYYKTKQDSKSQLYYIDQLLKADAVLNETYKYLISKIHKEYDTKELLLEKEKITAQLVREKYYDIFFICIILLLFLFVLFLTYRHFKNQKNYKQKFDELMSKTTDKSKKTIKSKKERSQILEISTETVKLLVKQLERSEIEKRFLEKDMTLGKLSAIFNCNSKYLSIIIFHYRGKRFVEYINDLRLEHLIILLKEDKRIRNYTNEALAQEAGFSSTQSFAQYFKLKTGMPAVFFVEQLRKENL